MDSDRLRLLEARWRLWEIEVDELHEVADDLLTAGEDSPALIRLFCLDRDELPWEGRAAFENLLEEWGCGDLSFPEAAEVISLDMARGLLSGRVTADEVLRRAEAINLPTFYMLDALAEWGVLADEFSWHDSHPYIGRELSDIETSTIELARSIVERHS